MYWFLFNMMSDFLDLGQEVCVIRVTCSNRMKRLLKYRVFRVSILGTVIVVLGRYRIVGYLDP